MHTHKVKYSSLAVVLILVAASLSGCEQLLLAPTPNSVAEQVRANNGRIGFVVLDQDYYYIGTTLEDGSDPIVFDETQSPKMILPDWSSDGTKVTYSVEEAGGYVVNILDTEASRVIPITEFRTSCFFPSWSPDESLIACTKINPRFGSGQSDILIMNADGTNIVNITSDHQGASQYYPVWSPNGEKIYYIFIQDDNSQKGEFYSMESNGDNPVKLELEIQLIANYVVPSPDGEKLAILGFKERNNRRDLFVINWDGSNLIQLTHGNAGRSFPAWSPDSSMLVYSEVLGNNEDIYRVNADGSLRLQLTFDKNADYSPNFSPDGEKLVFLSNRSGSRQIYVMDINRNDLTRITFDNLEYSFPYWLP